MVKDIAEMLIKMGASLEKAPKNVAYRLRLGDCVVDIYSSGSIVYGGKNCSGLKEAIDNFILAQSDVSPRIGCDESGKGEYFGPLVLACVYADRKGLEKLIKMGVKDSKKLPENKILELAKLIVKNLNGSVRVLMPEEYNKLYEKYNNLNRMLDDLYVELISKSVKRFAPEKVVVDKFSNTLEPVLRRALGSEVEIVVVPKAELDPVVAAASIVARAERVKAMKRLEEEYGLSFPKGNVGLKHALKVIPKSILPKVAKLHFKVRDGEG